MEAQWKPIESAPRDGTLILGYSREFGMRETKMEFYSPGSPGFDRWGKGLGSLESGWKWDEPMHRFTGDWKPTHWMPLPKDPTTQE